MVYHMASSVSGQDESNPALCLATREGKMELIFPLGTTRLVPQEKFKQKPCNKTWSRWLDIGLVFFFFEFMDLDSVDSVSFSVHIKELCQYPSILTPHLVNNPYFHMYSKLRYKKRV